MASPVRDNPALLRFVREHGLMDQQVEEILSGEGVSAELIASLLDLATVRYRTLDLWGQKAEFNDAIGEALARAAEDAS